MPPPASVPTPDAARRRARAVALGVLVLFTAAFLWDSIFAGRAFVMRDAVFDFLPWRRFAAQAVRDGSVPLWNPHSRFGQPFVAEPQSGFFYPPHHLFDFLPVVAAFKATLALHLLVASVGMYALLRRFGAAVESALLAAVVFAFGAYFTANLEFMSVMDTLAWAPWTILATCRVGDAWGRGLRGTAAPTLLLAAVLAVQALAGQVQVLAYTCVAALTYGIAVALAQRRRAAAVATAACFVAAAALAAGLALVQILPTIALIPHSVRAAGVDPGLDIASMAPRHLTTLLFPFGFGRPGAGRWWGGTLVEFWLGCVHIGLAPLLAAGFVALRPRAGARTVPGVVAASAALLVVGVLVAMGRHAPVYGWLQHLPGADLVRWPAKGLQLVAIALAVTAGLGFDALLARRETATGRIDKATFAFLGVAAALAVVAAAAAARDGAGFVCAVTGATPAPSFDAEALAFDARRSAAFLVLGVLALGAAAFRATPRAVGAGLVLVVSFVNLHLVSRDIHFVGDDSLLQTTPPAAPRPTPDGTEGHVDTRYPDAGFSIYGWRDPAAFRAASAVMPGSGNVPYGVSSTCAGDALVLTVPAMAVDLMAALPEGPRARLADALAIDREIRGPPFAEVLAAVMSDPRASTPAVVVRPGAAPRAYVVEDWERSDDPRSALERMASPQFDPRRLALVDATAEALPPPPSAPISAEPQPGRVVALRHDWNRTEVDVDVARPCLLVVCETWLPGWTARVDGVKRPIARVDAVFRGVALSPGDRRVSMEYEAPSFRAGAVGSCVATALLAAGFVWSRRGARRPDA